MKWTLIFALVFSFTIHALPESNDIKVTYQVKTGHTFYHDLKANSQKSKYFYNKPKKIHSNICISISCMPLNPVITIYL